MRQSKKLTNRIVEGAGPGRYSDGGGLYLVVKSPQARFWSLRYRVAGKPREMGLGPAGLGDGAMSLADARAKAAELRQQADAGSDPLAERDRGKDLHIQFLDHQAAIDKGRQIWTSMTPTQRVAASPGGEAEGEAMLTGDLSAMDQLAAANLGVNISPAAATLDLYRRSGSPVLALMALWRWPAHLPLAQELREFLALALADFVEAAGDFSDTAADPKEVNDSLLRSLDLVYAPGKAAAITVFRQEMRALTARKIYKGHLAAPDVKSRKHALELTANDMMKELKRSGQPGEGIPLATLEQWLHDAEHSAYGD